MTSLCETCYGRKGDGSRAEAEENDLGGRPEENRAAQRAGWAKVKSAA
jgi:hypothetical protein